MSELEDLRKRVEELERRLGVVGIPGIPPFPYTPPPFNPMPVIPLPMWPADDGMCDACRRGGVCMCTRPGRGEIICMLPGTSTMRGADAVGEV